MRVLVELCGIEPLRKDFVKGDLEYSKVAVKLELMDVLEEFEKDKNIQKKLINRIKGMLKRKLVPKQIRTAFQLMRKRFNEIEILEYRIIEERSDYLKFELEISEEYFKMMQELNNKFGCFAKIFKRLVVTKKEFLKELEKEIKNTYRPKSYKIKVVDDEGQDN